MNSKKYNFTVFLQLRRNDDRSITTKIRVKRARHPPDYLPYVGARTREQATTVPLLTVSNSYCLPI